MRFTISREKLQEGLAAVAASIPTKTTLPVLANILVETTEKGIRISGTDLDIAVSTEVIADVEAAAPGQTPLHAEKDWEDFPNEKRMAKELGEPYECDWFFLYWSMSKIAHPTAMNLLATSQIDTNPSGDGERALLVGFTNHYRIAEIVCSALGTPGNALKEHLDLKAKGFLTLANAIPTNGKCKTQFHYKLNGWQRLWAILAIAWAIPVLIFTTTTLPTESELKARWANERVNLIRKLHGQDESLAKYRFRLYGNASDEEIIHGKPAPISEQEEFEFRLRREKEIAARSAPASKNPESPSARSRFDLSTAVPSDDIDALNQKYEPRLAQLSTSQFRIIILGFLAWAIAPIALYLLGLGIRWVYLGFLRDKR